MVEMLGVLAVMGVLSIAGIAGYNSAMNLHRTNDLLYEASKCATVVAAQVLQGRTTFSIAEFSATSEKLGFTEVRENPKNPQQFQLKLFGADETLTDKNCITQVECGGTGSGYFCYYSTYDSSNTNNSCTEDPATAMGCAGATTASACLTQNINAKIGQCKKSKL